MQIWDFSSHLSALVESETQGAQGASSVFNQTPLVKFKHKDEGFAIDWNPLVPGRLVSGTVNSILFYSYFCICLCIFFLPKGTSIASFLTCKMVQCFDDVLHVWRGLQEFYSFVGAYIWCNMECWYYSVYWSCWECRRSTSMYSTCELIIDLFGFQLYIVKTYDSIWTIFLYLFNPVTILVPTFPCSGALQNPMCSPLVLWMGLLQFGIHV